MRIISCVVMHDIHAIVHIVIVHVIIRCVTICARASPVSGGIHAVKVQEDVRYDEHAIYGATVEVHVRRLSDDGGNVHRPVKRYPIIIDTLPEVYEVCFPIGGIEVTPDQRYPIAYIMYVIRSSSAYRVYTSETEVHVCGMYCVVGEQ